jgi:hypothetical protein
MEAQVLNRPSLATGIQPHLVFKIPISRKGSASAIAGQLERLDLSIVSIESDNAVVAFQNDVNLARFREAVATYEKGPKKGVNPKTGKPFSGTGWDVLEYIDAAEMRLWSLEDRIGPRLVRSIGDKAQLIDSEQIYILDIELWHRGTEQFAKDAIAELRKLIEYSPSEGERLYDSFIGHSLCLARVGVRGEKLKALLEMDSVAEIDQPPQPFFDFSQVSAATARQFPTPASPPIDGPSVCIIDSGVVTNHPLLANHIGHAESVMPHTDSASDAHGHGTMVGGIAVFGDIRANYEGGQFASPVTLFSARVLNERNEFDNHSLIIHQMRRAVEFFIAPPYRCRVFNLSLGNSAAWLQTNQRQSFWAESLDILAREYNVVLVVSAGNHAFGRAVKTDEAEEILRSYPDYLFRPECGLCEPATAAIPITVGGYAKSEVQAVPRGVGKHDIFKTVAMAMEPTPHGRIGPGINSAIKPEFVADAGNVAFQGFSELRKVDEDRGISVMSFSNEPIQRLFAFGTGSSLAAPQVARLASMVVSNLREQLGDEPDANLVRALLASAGVIPRTVDDRILKKYGDNGLRRVYGYGAIDEDVLFESADRRVTLIAQASIPLDTFAIYEVPSPIEFRTANERKRVTVTLAYDPPVRRRRSKYLGVQMGYTLIRGKSIEQIIEAYRHLSPEERAMAKESDDGLPGAFKGSFKCELYPGTMTLMSSTLQRSEWTFTSENRDYGDTWYLVVQSQRTWAPDSFTEQRFAVTVTLEADEPELFNLIENRIRVRQQQRTRVRQ